MGNCGQIICPYCYLDLKHFSLACRVLHKRECHDVNIANVDDTLTEMAEEIYNPID